MFINFDNFFSAMPTSPEASLFFMMIFCFIYIILLIKLIELKICNHENDVVLRSPLLPD